MTEIHRETRQLGSYVCTSVIPGEQAPNGERMGSVTQRRLLAPNGTLDGEDVLPGFTFAVAELFKEWEW